MMRGSPSHLASSKPKNRKHESMIALLRYRYALNGKRELCVFGKGKGKGIG